MLHTNPVSLQELDADGLGYVGKAGMISMFVGMLELLVRDKLYKLQGFPVTKSLRQGMAGSTVVIC